MFRGLGHLVDVPKELYYGNAQYSSIRISSSMFAYYVSGLELQLEETTGSLKGKELQKKANKNTIQEKINRFIGSKDSPIFLSDIVNFRCNLPIYLYKALGSADIAEGRSLYLSQVQAIVLDYRSVRGPSINEGNTIIKVRKIQLLQNILTFILLLNPALEKNEWFLVDKDILVLVDYVTIAKVGILMHYAFQASYKPEALLKGNPPRFVRRILKVIRDTVGNTDALSVRLIQQSDPVRGKLELNYFSRKQLTTKFCRSDIEVILVPLYFYIDVFSLYRNIYRALIGVYLFLAPLTNKERRRRANIIPLTLGPYSCNLLEVIDAIGAVVAALNAGIEIQLVNRTKKIVYAQILAFISNILQQQLNASFLSQKAKFSCRNCTRPSNTQNNLDISLKLEEQRYYYNVIYTRIYLKTNRFKTAKAKNDFIQIVGKSIKLEARPLERITLALDLKISTPADVVYSEMQGLVKRVYLLLKDTILIDIAIKQYYFLLTAFLLLGNWQAL